MARIPRSDFDGAVHHIYGRGNRKQPIFRDDADCQMFLSGLGSIQREYGIRVLAYCLMINHYHLVLKSEQAALSKFMHRLLSSYSRRFNDRWAQVGHLFQDRFGDRRCKTDSEVMGAIRYVHLNPVEAKLVPSPEMWRWSGHRGILELNDPLVSAETVLDLFGGKENYVQFLSQPLKKEERRPTREIALALFGPDFEGLLIGSKCQESVSAKRKFAVAALSEGHRRSAIASFLQQTPASITKLLRGS